MSNALSDLVPGDCVTVFVCGRSGYRPARVSAIVRIGKRDIVLADGTRWRLDGRRQGESSFCASRIEPTTPEHVRAIQVESRRRAIVAYDWRNASDAIVEAVHAALTAAITDKETENE